MTLDSNIDFYLDFLRILIAEENLSKRKQFEKTGTMLFDNLSKGKAVYCLINNKKAVLQIRETPDGPKQNIFKYECLSF